MKKEVIALFICMLLMITITTVLGYPKISTGEKNFYNLPQGPTDSFINETWTKSFGHRGLDEGFSVALTSEGGFILVGCTSSRTHGPDVWLIKTDANGNIIWNKTFGGKYQDWGCSVQQTKDGGYIVTGWTNYNSNPHSGDAWLIKTDANGTMVWNRTFDYGDTEMSYYAQQTSDGGYLTAVQSSSVVRLIKTDSSGNIVFDKRIGEGYWVLSMVETPDHDYMGLGTRNRDVWVFRTNGTGDLIWEKTYGGSGNEYGFSMVQTPDEKYVIAGETSSFGTGSVDVWVLKIDSSGNVLLNKTIGSKMFSEEAYSVKMTDDGGFIVAGTILKFGGGSWWHHFDGLLIKLDAQLNTTWTQTVSGFGNHEFYSVQQTPDHAYIVTGLTTRFLSFNPNVLLMKTYGMVQN